MKIAEIKGRVLKVPRFSYRWRDGFPRAPAERDGFLLQVIADNGVEGHCIATRRGAELGWQTASLLYTEGIVKKSVAEEGKCELTAAETFLKGI